MKIRSYGIREQVTGDRGQGKPVRWPGVRERRGELLPAIGFVAGLLATSAFAAEAPPSLKGEVTETEASETSAIPDGYLAPLSYNTGQALFGYETFAGNGNEWKFKQYHTPQNLPVLRILEWQNGGMDGVFRFALVQPGWTDEGGTAEYRHGGDRLLRVQTTETAAEFHPTLTINSADEVENRTQVTCLVAPNGARFGFYYRDHNTSASPGLDYPDYRAKDYLTLFTMPQGRWTFSLGDGQRKVLDHDKSARLNARSTGAGIAYSAGSRASVNATVSTGHNQSINTTAIPLVSAENTVLALDAVALPAPHLTIRGHLQRTRMSRNVTGLGYARGSSGGQMDVKYLLSPQLAFRAGWQSREIQFHNRDDKTDKPRYQSTWAGAAFQPMKGWLVVGNWELRRLSNDPYRANVPLPDGTALDTTDPTALFPLAPDRLRRQEIRLNAPLPHFGGLTVGWLKEGHENRIRTVNYDLQREDATFWLPITRTWNVTGTWTMDKMSGSQAYLQPWLSNSRVLMGSVSGPVGRRLVVSLLGMGNRVTGGFPAKSTWYAIAAHRKLTPSLDAELRLQRETFTDEVTPHNSYRATTLVAEGRTRF